MAPRQRRGPSRGLPPHTYARKDARTGRVYYSYQGPDGSRYGLGTNRAEAVEQAKEANLRRASTTDALWQRITAAHTPTIGEWADEHERRCETRGQAANTAKTRRTHLNRIRGAIGHINLAALTTRECAALLEGVEAEGKTRTAQAVRAVLWEMLRDAWSVGYISDNPAQPTKVGRATVQRKRLTLEAFMAIHAAARSLPDAWIARSMELALVSGQTREVLAAAQFRDADDTAWWCHRGKTDTRIRIPLALTLDVVGWSLGAVIRGCRDRVLSRYLIHHTRARTKSQPGDPVHTDTITRGFARARKRAGLDQPNAATFHEIRSLSERCYAAQGLNTQALLGHRDPRSTALYKDVRGAEWVDVPVE